jgi:hypothetical protein
MASNINFTDIDEDFPVAGQDNDTQGFRDNFSTIKTSFQNAKTEIGELQTNTAKLNVANDFNGNEITNAVFRATNQRYYSDSVGEDTTYTIDLADGEYAVLNLNGGATINLDNLGSTTQVINKLRIEFRGNGTVTWTTGGNPFKVNSTWPDPFTVTNNEPVFVDVWTTDGLVTYGQYHGAFVEV